MLADCTSHSAALPRLGLLDDLTFSYYPLLRSRWRLCRLTDAVHSLRVPLCPSCRSTAYFPSTEEPINAASAAMPLFRKQSAAEVTSLAPHGSKARLKTVTNRRDSWRSHVHRTRLRSACNSSSCKLPMCGVKGQGPLCPFPCQQGNNTLPPQGEITVFS